VQMWQMLECKAFCKKQHSVIVIDPEDTALTETTVLPIMPQSPSLAPSDYYFWINKYSAQLNEICTWYWGTVGHLSTVKTSDIHMLVNIWDKKL